MQHREVHAPHLPFLNQSLLIMPVALMSENVYEVASTSARRTGTFKATTSSTATTTAGAKTAATLHTHSRISRTRQAADHSSCATFKVLLFFCCYFCFVLFVPVGCAQLLSSIAGVGDLYTDPQIHTIDGRGMGLGNNGSKGIQRWVASHRCNAICRQLKLPQVGADAKPGTDHYARALNNTGFTSFCFVQTCLALSPDSLRW